MDSAELLRMYATLRLGASMKLLEGITPVTADRLLVESMPAVLTLSEGLGGDETERDRARAGKIRSLLAPAAE